MAEIKIITADEARENVQKYIDDKFDGVVTKISNAIDVASKQGKKKLDYTVTIAREDVIFELQQIFRDEGYMVTYSYKYQTMTITW